MQKQDNNISFFGQELNLGIDVHKKQWRVTIMCGSKTLKQMSTNPNAGQLADYLKRNYPGSTYKAVYEAGFSGFTACRALNQADVKCIVVNPSDVPVTAKEKQQKTDSIDSKKLARCLTNNELVGIHIPDIQLEIDRALVRQRERIVKDIARIKNRVKSMLFQFGVDVPDQFTVSQTRSWSKRFTTWLLNIDGVTPSMSQVIGNYVQIGMQLRSQLLVLTKQVRALCLEERYANNMRLVTSIPGFGMMTSILFLTQIGDVHRFKNDDQMNSYIGLIPKMHGSGDRMKTGKITNRGRKGMKIDLIEISWKGIEKDPALKMKFDELIKTMTKNKAIIRIARKMLSRFRHVLIHQTEYVNAVIE